MNIREGVRRLGILVGACGAVVGGCLSYGDAKSLWESRAAYRRFESLMASPTMRKVTKAAMDYQNEAWASYKEPARSAKRDEFGGVLIGEPRAKRNQFGDPTVDDKWNEEARKWKIWDGQRVGERIPDLSKLTDEQLDVYRDLLARKQGKAASSSHHRADTAPPTFGEFGKTASRPEGPTEIYVSVNLDGIKQVTADKAGVISLVELSTGELVPKAEAPGLRAYLIRLLYPILGFLVPWGAVRMLTWVGSGFFAPKG